MAVLLDTTFVIDHLRGQEDAVDRFRRLVEAGDALYVNDVVVCEAWAGARDPDDRSLGALLEFLEFVQPSPDDARRAGRWRAEARARGHTLAATDALIAAAAVSLDAAVLTRNVRDFALTPARVDTY